MHKKLCIFYLLNNRKFYIISVYRFGENIMKIYIMRHGETVWNKNGIIQGRTNNRLSAEGISQVEAQAEQYKDAHFDLIYSSPLMRTMQTANIMNRYHHCKIVKDSRIIEIDQGQFSGKKKETLTEKQWEQFNFRDKSLGMESFEELRTRVQAFIDEIKQKYPTKSLLIVSHGAPANVLYMLLSEISIVDTSLSSIANFKNAEIRFVDLG